MTVRGITGVLTAGVGAPSSTRGAARNQCAFGELDLWSCAAERCLRSSGAEIGFCLSAYLELSKVKRIRVSRTKAILAAPTRAGWAGRRAMDHGTMFSKNIWFQTPNARVPHPSQSKQVQSRSSRLTGERPHSGQSGLWLAAARHGTVTERRRLPWVRFPFPITGRYSQSIGRRRRWERRRDRSSLRSRRTGSPKTVS